ncbi:MAG: acetylornithine/succinylornithine family transaminase [Clostridia bacterium]|nr:acetylornithine/succinylornithine family transaminase [Clostridia bacterium]
MALDIQNIDREYIAGTYARFPVEIVSGKGSLVYDEAGKEYIDLGTGIAVNTFGVADEDWAQAVTRQLFRCQHTSNLYYSEPCAMLAKELCERTGMKKVFFSNSGAEANEAAIKVARKYAAEKKGKDTYTIITLKNSFHGRTLTTLAATGQDVFHADFTPLTEGFVYAEPNDLASVRKLAEENKVAAIMLELVQGEGGVCPLEQDFVDGLVALAAEKDILLIDDEVQTGNGRTGALYAYMNYGFTPDIVSTAKGLGGGLPIGACMLGEKVKDVLTPGSHGSTFGGNPAACAGARNVLSRLDEEMLAGVREKSAYLFRELQNAPGVKSVTGMGLMIGIETERDAAEILAECRENGVLAIKAKQKVRLLPALNIPTDLLEKAVAVIKAACAVTD